MRAIKILDCNRDIFRKMGIKYTMLKEIHRKMSPIWSQGREDWTMELISGDYAKVTIQWAPLGSYLVDIKRY